MRWSGSIAAAPLAPAAMIVGGTMLDRAPLDALEVRLLQGAAE